LTFRIAAPLVACGGVMPENWLGYHLLVRQLAGFGFIRLSFHGRWQAERNVVLQAS